jgi:hypothetical protein
MVALGLLPPPPPETFAITFSFGLPWSSSHWS